MFLPDRKYPSEGRSVPPGLMPGSLLLAAFIALLALQGCASSDTSTSDATTASGNGTTDREQLLHMGISENSYANRNSGNRH